VAGELVLVIEDNDMNMKLVRKVLEFRGYRTAGASTAEEGLALADAERPDLILMDLQLPGMDGAAALQHLRARPEMSDIPVVALTALALQQDRDRYLEAGFDAYVTKPVDVNELAEQVRQFCASRPPTR
jgi:two-component system, cell cycle response regulator DivK